MFIMVNGSNPALDKNILVQQANASAQFMENFMNEARATAESKKQAVIQENKSRREQLESERQTIIGEIARLQGRLTEVEHQLNSMNDNEQIANIQNTLLSLDIVHQQYLNEVSSIINHLHV